VSVSDAPPPIREGMGTSSPDLSRTIPSEVPPAVASVGPSHALAATVPAIPSQILAQQTPPMIAPGGRMFEGASSKGGKSRVLWWLVGGVALFGVGLGAASLFVKHGEPPMAPAATQASISEPAKVQEAPPPAATPAPEPPPAPVASAAEPKPEPKPEAKVEPKPEPKAETPAPAAGGNTGTLVVERGGGHRIYLDGKVVAQGAGSHVVSCGKHTVRVGSDGKAQEVTVPCGGSITVQ